MHSFIVGFISGFSIGLEFFFGDKLLEGDRFAFNVDLGIIRVTYVLSEV